MDHPIISPKKLIEVALPLDAINVAAAREKSIRHGHPSTLHLWWARRPLAAARAVIFSQLVHDPEDLWRVQNPGIVPNAQIKGHWTKARERLFKIIEDLVKWENINNESMLEKAREEIRKSWREVCELNKDHPHAAELFNPDTMPGLHDPFAGGGSIPLEAQRLGLEAYASDLNPVAVLINKAMIEIPPKFANCPPASSGSTARKSGKLGLDESWRGAAGLAEDVRYYGQWMRDEAFKRIGHIYPPIEITKAMVKERPDLKPYEGEKLTVIAWLWARTVKSPNPAFSHVNVPLANTFILTNRKQRQCYVEPIVEKDSFQFVIRMGCPTIEAQNGTSLGARKGFRCLMSGTPIDFKYIRKEGIAGRMGNVLLAIVAEGNSGRVYLSPTTDHESIAKSEIPTWKPSTRLPEKHRSISAQLYGLETHGELFTDRQLIALNLFSDLIEEVRISIEADAIAAGYSNDGRRLEDGGVGAAAYSEAVCVYLAFALDKCTDRNSSLCGWDASRDSIRGVFGRQTLPMVWDFAESNPIESSAGSFLNSVDQVSRCLDALPAFGIAFCSQADAGSQQISIGQFVSTDPPYYDNIGYADLSDFFYAWIRRTLRKVFPSLLSTMAVPKEEELIASRYRRGSKEAAEHFFLEGMTKAMKQLSSHSHPSSPVTIYYAFKQSETKGDVTNSSGWESFLSAVINAGFSVTGTWPVRSELENRMVSSGTNALASCVVLVCRRREQSARTIGRREFTRLLNQALPSALDAMTRESEGLHSPVAPVDLSQAIIGPGMAVFSKYSAVLEADGTPMTVRTAMQLINRFLAEDDFDADTQFCLHWFEQFGWGTGNFGEADTLARAKGTSVDGVKQAGVLHAAGGNVRLLKWSEYLSDWAPQSDQRLPIWEVLHQMIRVFNTDGETGAAAVFAAVQSKAEAARQLAYRLYTLCERKGWAEDARAYNEVVTSWSGIESAASIEPALKQGELFE
jgi:putative DNA methylase